jgi:hypothetical protein
MKRSTAFGLACAFLMGAALAFPAGLLVDRRVQPDRVRVAPAGPRHAKLLNPYSPNITEDPHFIEQQRQGLEALERSCRETGKFCKEADLSRQWLAARGAPP